MDTIFWRSGKAAASNAQSRSVVKSQPWASTEGPASGFTLILKGGPLPCSDLAPTLEAATARSNVQTAPRLHLQSPVLQ